MKTLVIHASNLPYGKGWSPHIWEILNGASDLTVCLLEAEDKVDTGDIWKKINIHIPKTSLFNEINELIINAHTQLMNFAIDNFETIKPKKQPNLKGKYWPKRSPNDSLIDINQTISQQFDLLRVCDPNRFPAFFYINGLRFNIKIEKSDE